MRAGPAANCHNVCFSIVPKHVVPGSSPSILAPPGDGAHLFVGGKFTEWLNITDPIQASGVYLCEACTGLNTASEQCNIANLTFQPLLVGAPVIDQDASYYSESKYTRINLHAYVYMVLPLP